MAKNAFKTPIKKQRQPSQPQQKTLLTTRDTLHDPSDSFHYTFEHIDIEKIITNPKSKPEANTLENIKNTIKKHGQLTPVILKGEFIEEEKFGLITKKTTGEYHVILNEEFVWALRELYQESKNPSYSMISSLIVPLDVTEEQIQEITGMFENGRENEHSLDKKIMKTQGQSIEFCFDYQEVYLDPYKLREEHNSFDIDQIEVNALADSIRTYGMFELPLILPYIDNEGSILYRIIAGHKRIRAVKAIIEKARNNEYDNSSEILNKLSKIKVRLLPLGCTPEQEKAVHEYSNLMRRQITMGQALEHIYMIPDLPKIPSNHAEYDVFIHTYKMKNLADIVIRYFRALGFRDWKTLKAQRFLSVYYFGAEKVKEEFSNPNSPLNQKELVWIATEYKGYFQRKQQNRIVSKALEDKTFLLNLMKDNREKRKQRVTTPYKKMQEKILREGEQLSKILDVNIEAPESEYDIVKMRQYISNLKKQVIEIEQKIEELKITKKI